MKAVRAFLHLYGVPILLAGNQWGPSQHKFSIEKAAGCSFAVASGGVGGGPSQSWCGVRITPRLADQGVGIGCSIEPKNLQGLPKEWGVAEDPSTHSKACIGSV